jgi:ribosomal protein S13
MGATGFAVASGLSLAGGIWGALAARNAGVHNEAMAEYDARQLEDQAVDAIARGEEQAGKVGEAGRLGLGDQRAALAGQGIEVGVGIGADLQRETMTMVDRDIETVRANAAREALGLKIAAISTRATGKAARAAGKNEAIGTLLTGGAQAISQAGQAYDAYRPGTSAPSTIPHETGHAG